jgi:histidinol-phosphatase (PHP family)
VEILGNREEEERESSETQSRQDEGNKRRIQGFITEGAVGEQGFGEPFGLLEKSRAALASIDLAACRAWEGARRSVFLEPPNATLSDYHLHTPLCRHATGWPVEYARAAAERGLSEIGFSDHNPMPEYFDDWRMLIDELPRYFEAVEEARREFPGLTIRLGLECDFIAGKEGWIEKLASMAEWDYLIGSVHYLPEGWEVDNPKYLARFREGNVEEIWTQYWQVYQECIRSGLFDFVAHPDLPKKFGFKPGGDLRRFYEPVIAALAETGTPFEINTAGLRKECRELYPSTEFLRLAREANVPLLINSDSHDPKELSAGFDQALAAAKEAGYSSTLRFHRRERREVPF